MPLQVRREGPQLDTRDSGKAIRLDARTGDYHGAQVGDPLGRQRVGLHHPTDQRRPHA